MLKITFEEKDEYVIVHLKGKLDLGSELYFKKKMEYLLERQWYNLIFNMENVEYINSFGLGVLTNVWRRVKNENGILKLASLPDKIKRLFQLTWLTKVFDIYETVEEAEKDFLES